MLVAGCALSPTSAYKVAAGTAHVPIKGKVATISAPDLAAAIRTLGTQPIYRINIVDRDHIVVDMQPVSEGVFQGDIVQVQRVNGQWRLREHVVITP